MDVCVPRSGVAWVGLISVIVEFPGVEVIKLEFIFKLKIKRNDWLLADTCPQAANHCIYLSLRLYSSFITSRQLVILTCRCYFFFFY